MAEKHPEKNDIIHICILLAVACFIGLYLISTTAVIAIDGTTFIGYAKNLEISPTATMIKQAQHPGYPVMILCVNRIARFFSGSQSISSWIYCAQGTAFVFRILTIIALYFLGKKLVGSRLSFFSLLILLFLPKPAHYGSDALSDWPHLFFLAIGILLLVKGAIDKKWWLFGFAGLAGGIGYLVRPECAQVVVYGCLWSVSHFIYHKTSMPRRHIAIAIVVLISGFLVSAGPYIALKGAVFPKKHVGQFAAHTENSNVLQVQRQASRASVYTTGIIPPYFVKAVKKLCNNIGETLMWFFVPALLIGLYKYFRKRDWYNSESFFIVAIIFFNLFLMVWLYRKAGYMSVRHSLPLVVFMIFYVPIGLQSLANWLEIKFRKRTDQLNISQSRTRIFVVLMTIGIAICIPKLFTPLHYDKLIFLKVANWLRNNTKEDAVIAVPDIRISFYSERKGLIYNRKENIKEAQYIVEVSRNKKDSDTTPKLREELSLYSIKDRNYKINVYDGIQR